MPYLSPRDPIARVQNWVNSSRSANPVNYQSAIEVFETDFVTITAQDRIGDASPPLFPYRLDHLNDRDGRPGEVEIPEQGSFHSTATGFHLQVTPSRRQGIDSNGAETSFESPRDSRSYVVDVGTSEIRVTHEGALGGKDQNPSRGLVETYIIDTRQETIRDYQRRIKFWS